MAAEQMRMARDLIKEKRYDEARAILIHVDDPRAQQWLEQIDHLAPASSRAHPLAEAPRLDLQDPDQQSPLITTDSEPAAASYVMALIGGFVGAVIAGLIWAAIAVITDYEIGYAAIGVGALAGGGVLIASNRRKGLPYQLIAVVTSVLGIFIGKFLTAVYVYREVLIEDYGMAIVNEIGIGGLFSDTLAFFPDYLSAMLEPIDILFVVLAVITAWGIPSARAAQKRAAKAQKTAS